MNDKSNSQIAVITAWSLSALVAALAIIVWGHNLGWHFKGISVYQVFPIFGLLAFSTMWSHYMISFLNRRVFKKAKLATYYKVTGYIVLVSILLHPGLLTFQRFRDGFGLPPGSLTGYVQASSRWIVLLGTTSFLVFISFEFRRWLKHKSWWKYVLYANDAAMLAIFYHGLRLGSNLHGGWFNYVWYFYGLTLLVVIIDKYRHLLTDFSANNHKMGRKDSPVT